MAKVIHRACGKEMDGFYAVQPTAAFAYDEHAGTYVPTQRPEGAVAHCVHCGQPLAPDELNRIMGQNQLSVWQGRTPTRRGP